MRYTFSEEEDFDSDNLSVRRSGRQSGRETPAAPSGPTVTASGRQVRSRATGLYGETLHSGQVTDRASPATGDDRSDVSEDRQQSGSLSRSARAANRNVSNGRALHRSLDSEDDDDATSWDGGDEDEDEPEQMELDDEDDGDQSLDEEELPHSLVVTLRYGKGAFKPSNTLTSGLQSETAGKGSDVNLEPTSFPISSAVGPSQKRPDVVPAAPPSPSLPPSAVSVVPHSLPVLSQQPPIVSLAHQQVSVSSHEPLPRLETILSAPPPSYVDSDAAAKASQYSIGSSDPLHQAQQQQQATQPHSQLPQSQLPPFSSTALPAPASASSWQ